MHKCIYTNGAFGMGYTEVALSTKGKRAFVQTRRSWQRRRQIYDAGRQAEAHRTPIFHREEEDEG